MKFEKTQSPAFLNKWRYQAQFLANFDWETDQNGAKKEKWKTPKDAELISDVEDYLTLKALGEWLRIGNTIYIRELDDIFRIRLLYDESLRNILEAGNYPKSSV